MQNYQQPHQPNFDPAYHSAPPSFVDNGHFHGQNQWPAAQAPSYPQSPANGPGLSNNQAQNAGRGMQLKSHGSKHAMQIQESTTKGGWFTVAIESAAKLVPDDPNNKKFNWDNKTQLQLTRNELPVFIAAMLGMLPYFKGANHGDQNKWLEVINQNDHFVMKTGGAGIKLHITPVPITEAYLFGCLALRQFVKNFEGMQESAALTIIERMANQLFGSTSYQNDLKKIR